MKPCWARAPDDDLGERREDRVLELGQDEADEPGAFAAQLGRSLVAQDVERGQDRLARRFGDAGLLVEDAADGRLTDPDLACDVGETVWHGAMVCMSLQELASPCVKSVGCCAQPPFEDDVHELAAARHDDPIGRATAEDRLDLRVCQDRCLDLRRRGIGATTIRSRSLPLTWTGISRVDSAIAAASTSGHVSVWIDVHGRPAAAAAARPELLGDVRRGRRQHQQQQADRLVPARRPRRPPCRGSGTACWSAPSAWRPSC